MNNRMRVEIYDDSGNLIADVSDYAKRKKITFTRNSDPLINITFDASKLEELCINAHIDFYDNLLTKGVNELRIWRDDVVIASGQINYTSLSTKDVGIDITVSTDGWFNLLKDRYLLGATSYNQDAGQIAWDAINLSQNNPAYLNADLTNDADFGITQGVIQSSVVRERDYQDKNVKDLVVQLSEVNNGFDFEITWDKKFNVYYPKMGIKRDDIVFSYPGNIQNISTDGDATEIYNELNIYGSGTGDNKVKAQVIDRSSISKYKLRQNPRIYNDVINVDTLTEHGNGIKSYSANPSDILTITVDGRSNPEFGTYRLGDEVLIVTDNQMALKPLNNFWRIEQMILSVDEDNLETVDIKVMK